MLDSRSVPALSESQRALSSQVRPPHSLENVGTSDLHVISVELTQDGTAPWKRVNWKEQ
jgi:hypothetical protein